MWKSSWSMIRGDCRCDVKRGKAGAVGLLAIVSPGYVGRMDRTQDLDGLVLQRRSVAPASPVVAVGALVLCCIFWGYSFPVMQFANVAFERHVLASDAE